MDEKLQIKALRKQFGVTGWSLLIYMLIMNVAVTLAMFVQIFLEMMKSIAAGNLSPDMEQMDMNSLLQNGWGYLLAIAVGYLILRLWKGKQFCRRELWTRGKPMTCGNFLALLCAVMFAQLLFQMGAALLEAVLNCFGLSAMGSVESASMSVETFSMFLYVCVLGPISEELLFRGLVLRTLMPYGKRFAIVMSAVLFGAFHGNLVQIPFAMVVGLVFGYVAAEYSIAWAMVLHMFNNLVLADMIPRLGYYLPEGVSDLLQWLLIIVCSLAAMIIAVVRHKEIGAYFRANKMDGRNVKAFFTAPGVWVMLGLMGLTAASMLMLY